MVMAMPWAMPRRLCLEGYIYLLYYGYAYAGCTYARGCAYQPKLAVIYHVSIF